MLNTMMQVAITIPILSPYLLLRYALIKYTSVFNADAMTGLSQLKEANITYISKVQALQNITEQWTGFNGEEHNIDKEWTGFMSELYSIIIRSVIV